MQLDFRLFRGRRFDNGECISGFFVRIGIGNGVYISAIQAFDELGMHEPVRVFPESVIKNH